MSIPPPPTPAPVDPAGGADIPVTALVSVLTMVLLGLLQSTLFRDATLPADMGYFVSTMVSYVLGHASGRLVRARRLLAAHRAASGPPAASQPPA